MNDGEAARSCKSVDRPSWREASCAIGDRCPQGGGAHSVAPFTRAWPRLSWIALPVFFSWQGYGKKLGTPRELEAPDFSG